MIIHPIGTEKALDTAKTLSSTCVNLVNTAMGELLVSIIDFDGNVVSTFTILGKERLTVLKPSNYSLSATGDIRALPVMRTQ